MSIFILPFSSGIALTNSFIQEARSVLGKNLSKALIPPAPSSPGDGKGCKAILRRREGDYSTASTGPISDSNVIETSHLHTLFRKVTWTPSYTCLGKWGLSEAGHARSVSRHTALACGPVGKHKAQTDGHEEDSQDAKAHGLWARGRKGGVSRDRPPKRSRE